ncbi:MAG: hypothetical protein QXG08_07165 [Candidatus Methanomethyliaceae archaeon]
MMTIKQFAERWRAENLLMFVHSVLEKRIKEDDVTKFSVFFTGLSAYCEPINLFLKGESGIGKSYNTTEALRHFPAGDVWYLGGLTPKALIHQYGVALTKNGRKVEELEFPEKPKKKDFFEPSEYEEAMKEWRRLRDEYNEAVRESYTLIDMSKKILVFLESPDPETFRMLLPILSHDKEEIEYRFTDKTPKGRLRTTRAVIRGWPAAVFLTTDRSYMEELSTRSFTVSPESSEAKIGAANALINEKASLPWAYEEDEEDRSLRALILTLKSLDYAGVIVPFTTLHELFPKKIVRDMRDFQHFCQFIKPITLLNALQRPWIEVDQTDPRTGEVKKKKYLVSTAEDVWNALQLYSYLFETTRTGTEERILKFYNEVLVKREVWSVRELVDEYNKTALRKVSKDTIERFLRRLSELGYADSEPDPSDKRKVIWRPIVTDEIAEIHRKFRSREFFDEVLKKGAQNWLEKIAAKIPYLYKRKNLEEVKIDIKEAMEELTNKEKIFSYSTSENFAVIFKTPKLTENEKIGEKYHRNSDFRQISANSHGGENCLSCGEYDPDQELCLLLNQRLPPSHSPCRDFVQVKFICGTCGCGPWKDFKIAQEHLQIFPNHKIRRAK